MARSHREHGPQILAGRFRGRRLHVAPGRVTRPVRALVRRSVFDILGGTVAGGRWLDLFAGSGAFGIEALSRGAVQATFVEVGEEPLAFLRRNLAELHLAPPEAAILQRPIPDLFDAPPPAAAPFDWVSLDPPFAVSGDAAALRRLAEGLGRAAAGGWLTATATLLWEEPAAAPDPVPAGFRETDRRDYGTARVRFFERGA